MISTCYSLNRITPGLLASRPFCASHRTVAGQAGRLAFETMKIRNPVEIRFWKSIIKDKAISSPFVKSPCWKWTGNKYNNGYGMLCCESKTVRAHRWAYRRFVGEIPNGLCVCHHCDNRDCVNPDHLFVGTQSDNLLDAKRKGRLEMGCKKGNGNYRTKLTALCVAEIRSPINRAISCREFGRKFGVCPRAIYDVRIGRTWKFIPIK